MKILLFVATQLITLTLLACPDFSGKYLRDYDGEEISITQINCEKITYTVGYRDYNYLIDNKEYLVGKYDIEGSDPGSIIANVEIYQKRNFKRNKLFTYGRSKTFYPDTGKTEVQKSVSNASYDKDQNIIVTTNSDDGSSSQETYLRLK